MILVVNLIRMHGDRSRDSTAVIWLSRPGPTIFYSYSANNRHRQAAYVLIDNAQQLHFHFHIRGQVDLEEFL